MLNMCKNRVFWWILLGIIITASGIYAFDRCWNWKYDFNDGRACVCVDGKWGYINRFHKVVIPLVYDNCGDFSEGVAYVGIDTENGTKYGCIDRNGNLLIPCVYDWCTPPIYDVIYVTLNGMDATFTKDGKECIPVIYDHIDIFYPENKGLARVKSTDGRYGFVKRNGDVVIPVSYEYCESFFTDGLARAKLEGQWGYLDHVGNDVIPFQYDSAGIFKDGRAEVVMGDETYSIDCSGK